MIEGISVQVNGDLQQAIEEAGKRYRAKFGMAPSYVCLPGTADPATLKLYTLQLGPPTSRGKTRTAHPGTVIVGRPVENGNHAGVKQLELFAGVNDANESGAG